MELLKQMTSEEIFNIVGDQQTKISFVNKKLMEALTEATKDHGEILKFDLPYNEIKNFVENIGEQILSEFSAEERKSMSWEHVGSTSIPGMPGTKNPDSLLIYEQFPPSKKIIDTLLSHSFHFWKVGIKDENNLWFIRFIPENGYLQGSVLTLHLVEKGSPAIQCLVGMRDMCRNEKSTFDEYKALKLDSASKAKHLFEYKKHKGQQVTDKMTKKILDYTS